MLGQPIDIDIGNGVPSGRYGHDTSCCRIRNDDLGGLGTEWSKIPNYYPYNYEQEHANQSSPRNQTYIHSGDSPISQHVVFFYTRYDKVTEDPSSSGTPPWTGNDATVYDNSETINRSYYRTLKPEHSGQGFDQYTAYYGAEMWTNGSQIAWRSRIKYVITHAEEWRQWKDTD
ncbi:MAG: hypothetical protein ACK4XJ_08315 [Fimbriimonadaceae bacterium]